MFNEQDGIYVKLQGKDRDKKKSLEVKAGIAYDGWEKRNPKSNEYVTTNKVVWAGVDTPKEFQSLSQVAIAKKSCDLFNYLALNRDYLIQYNKRENLKLPNSPEGKEYRSMGVMEHNIDINFVRRLKGQGKCWTINGVNKMSKILAIRANKGISEIIVSFELSAQRLSEIEEIKAIKNIFNLRDFSQMSPSF